MNVYDKFESKEKFLTFLGQYIMKDNNGKYYLPEITNETDFEEKESMKREMKSLKEENERLKNSTEKETSGTIEKDLRTNEEEKTVKMYSIENERLIVRNEEMKYELDELRKENENYRQKELRENIRKRLLEEARKLGIRPEAMRDVERLIYLISENEDGSFITEEGLTIEELLKKELSLSPHWLPGSQSGGSFSIQPFLTNVPQNVRYENAKKTKDITGMILNAPIIE